MHDTNSGSCLCGAVAWETSGKPASTYHCHCSMCRKAHGAAFGTYASLPAGLFRWRGGTDTIEDYRSSANLTRSFCSRCGSVVPNFEDDGSCAFVPTGCQDDGPPADYHIFFASRASWAGNSDNHLPSHADWPPGIDETPCPDRDSGPAEEGKVRGSCLCGTVEFRINEPFRAVYNCHCRRCRRARSAVFATNGFTSLDGVEITRGESDMVQYKPPEATYFTQVFCRTCGSKIPRKDPGRSVSVVPLGALDEDPGRGPDCHIFTAYRAKWHRIGDTLSRFDEGPE